MSSVPNDSTAWLSEFDSAGLALLSPDELAEFDALTTPPPRPPPEFRGGALDLLRSTGHERVLAGPAETGKTFAALWKLDRLLLANPGSQGVLVRKVRDTIFSTVLQTYQRKILYPGHPAKPYGGVRPQWYDYPNGGRLWLAGMDDPDKVLSSELDFVMVNQAEELSLDDWQTLCTRATGRSGNTQYPQVFGDCNPGAPHHWIKNRPTLTVLESRHEDNPALHDGRGWTEQGRRTLAILDSLTGVRKERLRYGRWVSAEGVVFEVDVRRHVLDRGDLTRLGILTVQGRLGPAVKSVVAGVDWGFTAPGVVGVWAVDGDGRMYLVREWYATGKLIGWWVDVGRRCKAEFGVTTFVCDPAEPAYIMEFQRAGLPAIPGDNDRVPGIAAVQTRLQPAGDNRPRLYFAADALAEADPELVNLRQPTCTLQECDSLVWKLGRDSKPAKEGETVGPDHGADACRYVTVHVDRLGRGTPIGVATPDPRRFMGTTY